ncbi:MAG: threonylcarbamoyl-AMP synthase [Spirochaetaceae bacterium]|jgi:L-threonylcarbamoyladenylate synthase|nr:threonylcarbamoyl-AMP synthase [Spirochaetaceae bacterium]
MIVTPSDENIERAAAVVKAGGLVSFPTETVYGLGADAFNEKALAAIFEVKNRPYFDPLIVHLAGIPELETAADLSVLSKIARSAALFLADKFLPGPLTLILPKQPSLPSLATGGLDTVAVRIPASAIAQKLIRLSTGAIAAPSANPFGRLSPTRAVHVEEYFADILILDGGRTALGLESTVLDLTNGEPCILREGGITSEQLSDALGKPCKKRRMEASAGTTSPGLLKSHYAPRSELLLYAHNSLCAAPFVTGTAYIFFEEKSLNAFAKKNGIQPESAAKNYLFALSRSGGSAEVAANLFDTLHAADRLRPAAIYAEQAPAAGLGAAINDRLFKAGGSKSVLA